MSILDILLISIGAIIVGIYAFIQIRQFRKFKKAFNHYKANGLTNVQAKEQAMKECYPKKYKKQHNNNTHEEIFEE